MPAQMDGPTAGDGASERGIDSAILEATLRSRLFGEDPFRIGKFEIVRRIGAGGMGVVYLAHDADLRREVAIKLLRSDLAASDPRARARMLREAQAMARLRHPNVVVVHEVGEHEGGVYIAMEFVRGSTLRAWLEAAPRSVPEIVAAYVQAGRGLAAAHDTGLVHRDFKPDNVLVGEDGRICVTDFGLAYPSDDAAPTAETTETGDASTLSSQRGAAGTLAYMAPECMNLEPATAASDQFSFCVALYEALWGRRPFGDSLAKLSVALAERRIPTPPRDRRVPRHVRTAVLRGLSHTPSDRYASMSVLLATLARDRRRRDTVTAVAVLVLGAVALAVYLARPDARCKGLDAALTADWNDAQKDGIAQRFAASSRPYAVDTWTRGRAAIDRYAQSWIDGATQACEATEIRRTQTAEMLDRRMTCLDRRRRELVALVRVLARADDEIIDRTDAAIARLVPAQRCADLEALDRRDPLPNDPAERASLEQAVDALSVARAARDTGAFAEAREQAERALEHARAHRPTQAEAQHVLGNALLELGDSKAAVDSLERAIVTAEAGGADEISASAWDDLVHTHIQRDELDEAERAIRFASGEIDALGDPFKERASLLRNEGELAARRGDPSTAMELLRRSDALLRANLAPDDPELAGSSAALAYVEFAAGDYAGARRDFEAAVEAFTAELGAEHPRTLMARSNLANVFVVLRQLDDALAEHRDVLAGRKRVLGEGHHLLTANLIGIAAIHYYRKEIPAAISVQEDAVRILDQTRGTDHAETLDARENLAAMLRAAGRPRDAAALALEVLAGRRRAHGEDHPGVATTLEVLARAEHADHDDANAADHLAQAIAIVERTLGADHVALFSMLVFSADLAHARGDHEQAVATTRRALAIGERTYGSTDTMLHDTLTALARCLRELGRAAEAEAFSKRATDMLAHEQDGGVR